jgi:predicted ATP-grasp superfamily ATP-dependent carboligase
MKILVFEYVTGGGLGAEPLPPRLAREGGLMLEALVRDLAAIPEVRPVVLRDGRLPVPPGLEQAAEWVELAPASPWEPVFRSHAASCAAVWPIAPETGGLLENLCRIVAALNPALLSSPADTVRIAASKADTARRLAAAGVPVVPTALFDPARPPRFPAVVKPDDGVGCEGTRIIATAEDWRPLEPGGPEGPWVVQPWVDGEALSLSALFGGGRARLLAVNRQSVVRDSGGFRLQACVVNAVPDESGRFRDLADQVAAALPGLWGYAGIDLIRSGRDSQVLEVNPRLTTSYAGLRRALRLNPAALVLDLWRTGRLPEFGPARTEPVEIALESPHGP